MCVLLLRRSCAVAYPVCGNPQPTSQLNPPFHTAVTAWPLLLLLYSHLVLLVTFYGLLQSPAVHLHSLKQGDEQPVPLYKVVWGHQTSQSPLLARIRHLAASYWDKTWLHALGQPLVQALVARADEPAGDESQITRMQQTWLEVVTCRPSSRLEIGTSLAAVRSRRHFAPA